MSKRSSISLYLKKAVVDVRGYRNAVIFIADAHRDDRRRFVTHADDKLTAFLELEAAGAQSTNSACWYCTPPR
jgi:hypothetical protein